MALLDLDSLQEQYDFYLENLEEMAIIDCQIKYETNAGTWDEVSQSYTSEPVSVTNDVKIIARDERKIGDIISSGIVSPSTPIGIWLVFLKPADILYISKIAHYVANSLRFVLRPDTDYELTLYPRVNSAVVKFLADITEFPLHQEWVCSIVQEV